MLFCIVDCLVADLVFPLFTVDAGVCREDLFFNYTGGGDVLADIGGDGMVTLYTADENWHGTDTLTFKATDSRGQMAYQAMKVTVKPVNDPPWIENATITPAKPKTDDKLTLSLEPEHYNCSGDTLVQVSSFYSVESTRKGAAPTRAAS